MVEAAKRTSGDRGAFCTQASQLETACLSADIEEVRLPLYDDLDLNECGPERLSRVSIERLPVLRAYGEADD